MDRATAIEHVRVAARGYCLLAALADAGAPVEREIRREWMKSAARLIRFAFLLETDRIEYSGALAAVLAQLLQESREG
jgi:hypothetical protein